MIVCPEILDQIIAHAIQAYPHEACGILRGPPGQESANEFIPLKNVYDEMKRKDPKSFPRDARTAYMIDPKEQQQIFVESRDSDLEVKAIVHSHTDHDAYFSEEDRKIAAPWGEPNFPGISYVVVSIWNKKFKEANEFIWDDERGDFVIRKP